MALTKVKSGMRTLGAGEVATANMATDPTNADNLTSGSVPLAQLGNAPATDVTGLEDDIALLGFKVAANGSLAKYNLVDQAIDAFEDASGVDASASTDEVRNANNYYTGADPQTPATTTFTSTPGGGTWTVPAGVTTVDAIVVAGGGGGAGAGGGGGGGGGVLAHTTFAVTPAASVTVTVGAGGAGSNSTSGTDSYGTVGDNSVFSTLTAFGGGRGGAYEITGGGGGTGGNGGSGGGGGGSTANTPGGSATQTDQGGTGYGNAGGQGKSQAGSLYVAGGGGGSAGVGAGGTSSPATGGNGGSGQLLSTWASYGDSGKFGGGGGGGAHWYPGTTKGGQGGTGGGGAGAQDTNGGSDGTANTGGGGGGGWLANGGEYGGDGGSGFIGLKYTPENYNDIILVSNATTAEAEPTKADLVMTISSGTGTTSIGNGTNGDVRVWASRDDGTTYTQFTLVDQGDTAGHTILTAHDLSISGQPSGSAMRYKVTTHNQGASLETRIQAVSLGWS